MDRSPAVSHGQVGVCPRLEQHPESSVYSDDSSESDLSYLEHCSPLASSILQAMWSGASPIFPPRMWTWAP